MRSSARKLLPFAIGLLLVASGAVFAGDNAGVVLSTPTEISGVGAGEEISVTIAATGLVEVKNVTITLRFPNPEAFNLAFTGGNVDASFILFAPNEAIDALAAFDPVSITDLSSDGNTLLQGGGGAFPNDPAMDGDADLGTFTITMADDYDGSEVTIEVFDALIGKNSSDQDAFTADQIGLTITINPPAPAPTITAIDPNVGLVDGGTEITITGANFQEGATVSIGGTDAGGTFVDATTLTATSPEGEEGAADVVVANSDGQSATSEGGFTYELPPPIPPPVITAVDPAEGSISGGTEITITGTDFQDGATVSIGGTDAGGTFVDATTLTATSPEGEEGAADVVVTNPDEQSATSEGGFTYLGVVEPRLVLRTAADVSLNFSPVGSGGEADGSDGEHSPYVGFTDASGGAAADQEITWTITNNGAETVFVIDQADGSVTEIGVGETVTTTALTNEDGNASLVGQAPSGSGTSLLDAEGDKSAGSTSLVATASTTAENSEGESRVLDQEITVTWDVAVAAELASFVAGFNLSNEILLEWGVASQTNNLGWEVYRSGDNRQFGKVGDLIFGDGTTDEYLTYSFTDTDLPQVDVLYYYLKQIDLDGTTARSQVVEVLVAPTAVERRVLPTVTTLLQNFPNPFNPETTISFDLSEEAVVSLTIYDLTGQVVRTLVANQSMAVGHYAIIWDGRNAAETKVGSGMYFYQLKAGDYVAEKKMTLLQ